MMKSVKFKTMVFTAIMAMLLSGCTKDNDPTYNAPKTTLLAEDFNNSDITLTGWQTYAQTGTKNWSRGVYKNDGYAMMSSFNSGQPVNVAWLISPAIDMDKQEGEKLHFQSCQDGFVRNIDNSLELFVSTDYDGTNFNNASWEKVNFRYPTQNTERYLYINSGIIDLSSYKGILHFAYKYYGTSTLTGGYQVDKVRVFY